MTGLEPANGGTTTHCLNHLATPAKLFYNILTGNRISRLVYFVEKNLYLFISMSTKKQFNLNGTQYYTEDNITLSQLISYFNYNTSLIVLEYNNLICEKKNWNKIFLKNNDRIELVTIVGGG